MTLSIDERFNAKNWTPAALVPATWGIGPRTLTHITIHWWGNPVGQTYAGIVDWFCNPQSSVGTSAHFVASAGQVACIVSPDDAAWHAGSAYGNVHSIGIECNPRCSDGDYQTIGELVAYLRGIYGNLPIVSHNYWTQTTCPGDYRLERIDAIANGQVVTAGTTTTPLEDTLAKLDADDLTNIARAVWAYKNAAVTDKDAFGILNFSVAVGAETQRRVTDTKALVQGITKPVNTPAGEVQTIDSDGVAAILAAIKALPADLRADLKTRL